MESKIMGNALVVFGGKIGGRIICGKETETNNSIVVLRLYELLNKSKVGELVSKEDYPEQEQVALNFYDTDSIDVVIEWLQKAKSRLISIKSE